MNKKLLNKTIFALLFLFLGINVVNANEGSFFSMMHIECFQNNMEYFADITLEFYQDKTLKARIPFNYKTGHCGGQGVGTWEAAGPFLSFEFKLTLEGENDITAFSGSGMRMIPPLLFKDNYSFVLGIGEIINPECFLYVNEKFLFLGFYTSEIIMIILD